jgi:hypothetical protein
MLVMAILLPAMLLSVLPVFPAESAQALPLPVESESHAEDYFDTQPITARYLARGSRSLGTHQGRRVFAEVPAEYSAAVEVAPENNVHRRELQAGVPGYAAVRQQEALADFIASLALDGSNTIAGVFVPDTLAMQVRQQPAGKPGYVSSVDNILTQFGLASQYGTTGLLAHNDLAGTQFFNLSAGQQVFLVKGDGTVKEYTISTIRRFQAKQPNSPFSNFLDLDQGDVELSVEALFYQVYRGADQVVFQTCIEQNGISTWGRLFVIATASS